MIAENQAVEVHQSVEHLFRHEGGKIVSTLTRVFGLSNLQLAEDVVQEALLKALKQWSYGGIPQNPSGWLMRVAKNQALDVLRRETSFRQKEEEIAGTLSRQQATALEPEILFSAAELKDDQLRMIFACCHAALSTELQVGLTLKTLCGFSVGEIARAFLLPDETIAKRLTRAKQRLREASVPFEIPIGAELSQRLNSVLQVLYLLFNEGYNASHGAALIRPDLCEEAIRLARLLNEHSASNTPKTHALQALMLLQAARFPARLEAESSIPLLQEQDRTRWNRAMIAEGVSHLGWSAAGKEASDFHLQAGIAACHSLAENYEETNWPRILSLYDLLVKINHSPVIALNRAVALAKVQGPEAGLKAVAEIRSRKAISGYYLLYAVLGEFYLELKEYREAEQNYRSALQLSGMSAEQRFLRQRLIACEEKLRNN